MTKREEVAPDTTTRLRRSREEAERLLKAAIAAGKAIEINNLRAVNEMQASYARWDARNSELLVQLFTRRELANDYEMVGRSYVTDLSQVLSPREEREALKEKIDERANNLQGVLERLDLFDEPPSAAKPPSRATIRSTSRRVFVVHGHDEGLKEQVARLLTQLEFEPVILHERPNGGRTLIEKLEHNSEDIGFAVVLLTGDDVGETKEKAADLKPRARQNVVMELGYFVGKLGRSRVCALYKGPLDLPSDLLGVVYTAVDGNWHQDLVRELREAGFVVDANLLL